MKILVITEKHLVSESQRDGGARVIQMLESIESATVKILDFSVISDGRKNPGTYVYPFSDKCRFRRRLMNKEFVSGIVHNHISWAEVVVFVHCSMMFGINADVVRGTRCVLFPMFTTDSYLHSGENIPAEYYEEESRILQIAELIITPSLVEKKMLLQRGLSPKKICVISRGVASNSAYVCRSLKPYEPIKCFSLGSIKPQKNPQGVLEFFEKIAEQRPGSTLKFIGPIQNEGTEKNLLQVIKNSKFADFVSICNPIKPSELSDKLLQYHLHISASLCETFGRAIIETAMMGIPNIILRPNNAAAPLLGHRLGVTVLENVEEFDAKIWLNSMTLECRSRSLIGLQDIFDEGFEQSRVVAAIQSESKAVVVDFDGTLYHKNSPSLTKEWVNRVSKYSTVIVCTARSIESLMPKMIDIGMKWDAVVTFSGGVITTKGKGDSIISELQKLPNGCSGVKLGGHLIQAINDREGIKNSQQLRVESYAGKQYFLPWKTTKLRGAVIALSQYSHIGRVDCFGDGEHDLPMIHYFGGSIVCSNGLAILPGSDLDE